MFKTAPIALFTFNRLPCLEQTIAALKNNLHSDKSELYIFSDGPKFKNNESEIEVKEVRNFLEKINGFKKVIIRYRSKNLGLEENIISGVSEVVNIHGSVIVLEDDLITGRYFLDFMNKGLRLYEKDKKVISIHGYSYFRNSSDEETYFIKNADNLGWATWKRGWSLFEKDSTYLYNKICNKKTQYDFNRRNSYNFLNLLKMHSEGRLNSWAIRWYASAFLNDMYTLYPNESLVLHIGDGPMATNYKRKQTFVDPLNVELYTDRVKIKKIEISETPETSRNYEIHLRKYKKPFLRRLYKKISSFFIKSRAELLS